MRRSPALWPNRLPRSLLGCAVTLSALLLGCGGASVSSTPDMAPVDDFPPPDVAAGIQMSIHLSVPAGTEAWKCQVGPLATDGPVAVHSVSHRQTPGVHHMDISVLNGTGVSLAPGTYDCAPLYAMYPQLMQATTIYASVGPTAQIDLPDGVAAVLPPGLTIMQELHIVNATRGTLDAYSKVNAYYMDMSAVKNQIYGQAIRDVNINIPPKATNYVEWTRCVMNQDVDVLFLSSHTHQLETDFTIKKFDGKVVGEQLYDNNQGWQAPPLTPFSPTMHVAKGQGFEFACHYNNLNDHVVNWGFHATDEMCQMALVYIPNDPAIRCTQVGSSDGMLNNP